MALQTETHSSTSTAPDATATGPPGPPPDSVDHTPFSPAGSPPLILAFLAIGLFAAAMIVVFGFRRIQLGRQFRLGNIPREHGGSLTAESTALPRKPQLWEVESPDDVPWSQVWGNNVEKRTGYDGHWANMMPLSANMLSTEPNPLPEQSKPPPPQNIPPEPLGRTFRESRRQMLNVWPQWRPLPARDSDGPEQSHEAVEEKSDRPVSKTLQVGVAIIMPSPQRPIYIKRRTDSGFFDGKRFSRRPDTMPDIPDYSIGLYECSWD